MKRKLVRWLPWLMLAFFCAASVAFYARVGLHNLSADLASDMLLAYMQNEEGTLVSSEFLYSTEMRIVGPVHAHQLGLLLFDSWHAARTFSVALLLAAVIGAYLFMARQAGAWKSAPYVAAILALPHNANYAYISLYGGCYAEHVALAFLTVGLVCRYGKRGFGRAKRTLALLAVLSLWGGLNGVRMLMMLSVPLFAAALIQAWLEAYRCETLRETAHTPELRLFAGSCVMMAASAAGYLVNVKVLAQRYSFETYTGLNLVPFKLEDILGQMDRIAMFFGYQSGVPLFSDRGIASLCALVICAAMVLALARLFGRFSQLEPTQKLLLLMALMAVIIGMVLNVLLEQLLVRYYLVGLLLLIAVMGLCWETERCKNALLRGGMLVLVLGLFAVTMAHCVRREYTYGKVNYEMAADWLVENGYTQGYATFWNANLLTEASDGEIEMWVLADSKHSEYQGQWAQMNMQQTLQDKSHLTQDPEGKVFLLVDEREYAEGSPLLAQEHLVGELVGWSYYVYAYDSAADMRALLAQGM